MQLDLQQVAELLGQNLGNVPRTKPYPVGGLYRNRFAGKLLCFCGLVRRVLPLPRRRLKHNEAANIVPAAGGRACPVFFS